MPTPPLTPHKQQPSSPFFLFSFADTDYLNFVHFNRAPQKRRIYFACSLPHALNQFDLIVGLSGSLGSPEEQAFLKAKYSAEFSTIPSFLNTCNNTFKRPPKLLNEIIRVLPNRAAQWAAVEQLALAKRGSVPVLIITETDADAEKLKKQIEAKPSPKVGAMDPPAVLLFVEEGGDKNAVVNATKPITNTATGQKAWRITVTSVLGGRGHDYKCIDEQVDTDGGLLVIMTCMPQSDREWVQWKGRTARSDRAGQYAVILSEEDEFLTANAGLIKASILPDPGGAAVGGGGGGGAAGRLCSPDLVITLLRQRDVSIKKELDEQPITEGCRLGELCDLFYAHQRKASKADELGRFLNAHPSAFTGDCVAAFGASLGGGIPATAVEYKAKSRYNGKYF